MFFWLCLSVCGDKVYDGYQLTKNEFRSCLSINKYDLEERLIDFSVVIIEIVDEKTISKARNCKGYFNKFFLKY